MKRTKYLAILQHVREWLYEKQPYLYPAAGLLLVSAAFWNKAALHDYEFYTAGVELYLYVLFTGSGYLVLSALLYAVVIGLGALALLYLPWWPFSTLCLHNIGSDTGSEIFHCAIAGVLVIVLAPLVIVWVCLFGLYSVGKFGRRLLTA